ncbi:MAG: CHAT domain-containing protein [Cytophagales bacterium]|nr:CHAT domain-containing protein [Cytophagales bacterium]
MNSLSNFLFRRSLCGLIFFIAVVSVFAQNSNADLYDNSEFKTWSTGFISGNLDEVLRSVEENLLNEHPHPLADFVWVRIHTVKGDLDQALKSAPESFKKEVQITADLVLQNDDDLYAQTWDSFSFEEIKSNNTPYRAYMWSRNTLNRSDVTSYDLSLASLLEFGDNFRNIWSISSAASSHEYIYTRIQTDLKEGAYDNLPGSKAFLESATKFRPFNDYDELGAVNLYLEQVPSDAIAMRFKAAKLRGLERFEDAAVWYEKAFQWDPFYYPKGNLRDQAFCFIKIGKKEEAQKVASQIASVYNVENTNAWALSELAYTLRRSGDYGAALTLLEEGLTKYPNDSEMQYLMGWVQRSMQRYDQAIPFAKKAVEIEPKNLSYQESLIRALRSAGKYEEALAQIGSVESLIGKLNLDLFSLKYGSFQDAEELEEAQYILEEAVEIFPKSSWMLASLGANQDKVGKIDKAIARMRATIQLNPNYTWGYDKLSEFLLKKYGNEKLIEEFNELANKYPWQERIWQKIAANTNGTDNKIQVWKRAIIANPNRLWPYESSNLRSVMNSGRRWDEHLEMLLEIEDSLLGNGSRQDQVNIHFEKAIIMWQKMFKVQLSRTQMENTIAGFNDYLIAGGRPAAVYNFQSDLYDALGDKEKAVEVIIKALELRPDTRSYATSVVTKYGGSISHLYDWMMRDPYNRAVTFSNTSVKWSGSPISALSILHRYDVDASWTKSKAFELLGNSAKIYEDYYVNKSSLGHERYIGWYNSARHSAWEGSTQLEIDYKTNTATIQFEDGTIAQRQDDIRLGKIRKIQIGDTWVTADYTSNGDLTKLETSAGKNIELIYSSDNKIVALKSSDGKVLNMEYNEAGKMTKIQFDGVGSLVVSYDEYDDIASTESFDESGEQGGSGLALQISQAFQELIGLTNILARGYDLSSGTLPNLGIEDLEYQRLQYANGDALDAVYSKDDTKTRATWLKTSLSLVGYLIDHTHVDAGYGYEAASILRDNFEWVKNNKDKKTQQYGVEIVKLFHTLLLKIRKRGVALDYWNDWVEMQEWLQLEKITEIKLTDYRKSIEKLQDHTNTLQIDLLATAEWLPKSMLQNDGFWKQYSLSAIIPRIHREGVRFNCMLYRKNGDLVLGTSKGLSVLRAGYWEWFGYNTIRSEWQTEMSATKLKGTSDIRALAETSDSTLLLGTPEGLLKIKGDYRGKQTGKLSNGLPSPIVSHLLTVDDQVLVGTTKGAVWYSGGQLENIPNLPLDAEINFASLSANEMVEEYDDYYYDENEEDDYYEEEYVEDGYYNDDGNWVESYYNEDGNLIESIYDDEGNIIEEIEYVEEEYGDYEEDDNEPRKVLIGTNKGVFVASVGEAFVQVTDSKDAGFVDSDGGVYLSKGDEVTKIQEVDDEKTGTKQVEISLFGNIVTSQAKGIYGLAEVPVKEYEKAMAVLTDLGFSIYHDNHFEHFYLPEKQKAKGLVNGYNNSFAGWSDESVWVFEKDNIQTLPGHIYDIVSADSLGITLVADGGALKFVDHADLDGSLRSATYYGNTTALALDDQNRIIANNGRTIMRFTYEKSSGEFFEEELFYANQYEPTSGEKYRGGNVNNIHVATDGTIWVTTKMSIFRYSIDENGSIDTQEFNYFRDSDLFPSRTHMLYRLVETLDGRILVVGSSESHLYQSGVSLEGGLLEWVEEENRFIRLETSDLDFNWVIHSYTAISETEAILGTTAGFARDKNGYIEDYRTALKDPSYLALYDQRQNLFLGTKGARLGDLWLFGSGAGVVAYQNGNWFYPDRINEMLPKDLELKNYGSRHVNAISTDMNGRVYVGTDLGFLVYTSGGATPMSFLLNNYREQDAFVYHSSHKVMQERDVLISGIDKKTNAGKIIAKIEANKKETKRLEKIFGKSKASHAMDQKETLKEINTDSLTVLIDNKQKQHIELLLQLEQADPAIHQLMNIQPVEIASMRKRFGEDECLVQFIPTKQKLFIQLLAKDKLIIREVNIGQDSLMRICRATANYISKEINDDRMLQNLEILYDNLLRPVADEIVDYEQVYIVPALAIYYVPFSALVNRISEREFKYAVEDFNFGYISSTHLLNLLFQGGNDKAKSILLMGDADGSLPAAQEEVKEIGQLVPDKVVFTGKEVTLSNLIKNAKNSGIIHLATHGFLNERTPNKSNILLAQEKRLSLPEAFNLPLNNTDMVVLSACQTAKGGGSGLEYATIARAFTNAGASTVLATLWKVNDEATKLLMVNFYTHLLDGSDKFTALAKAQRELLASDDEFLMHPHRWASFIPMGMP